VKILLVTNRFKEATYFKAQQIAAKLREVKLDVFIDDGQEKFNGNIDIIIVLGGDGTILRAARQYGQLQVPVLGVNMGTVGFLCNIEANELNEYVNRLIQGDFAVDPRMMLEAAVYRDNELVKQVYCLNEIVIKSQYFRMVSFNLNTSAGERIGIYRGDGVIIATPTGSTAYSLSSGGPVVDPCLEAFIITPIASYDINKRPLIVSANKWIKLTLLENSGAVICMDGQVNLPFDQNCEIQIKKAGCKLKLIDFKHLPFFSLLGSRLMGNKGEF
jgi:NAD+ kinase